MKECGKEKYCHLVCSARMVLKRLVLQTGSEHTYKVLGSISHNRRKSQNQNTFRGQNIPLPSQVVEQQGKRGGSSSTPVHLPPFNPWQIGKEKCTNVSVPTHPQGGCRCLPGVISYVLPQSDSSSSSKLSASDMLSSSSSTTYFLAFAAARPGREERAAG